MLTRSGGGPELVWYSPPRQLQSDLLPYIVEVVRPTSRASSSSWPTSSIASASRSNGNVALPRHADGADMFSAQITIGAATCTSLAPRFSQFVTTSISTPYDPMKF
jgi:hypothetical protein